MTLLAALQSFGAPAVIGDLLLTRKASAGMSSWLSTAPVVARDLPSSHGLAVAGTCKKVHILGPSLCIGWAGSALSAGIVVRELAKFVGQSPPRLKSIESLLAAQTQFDASAAVVHIIGWAIEDRVAHCFRWNSAWPTELFLANEHIEGTGETVFREALLRDKAAAGPGIQAKSETTAFRALAACGKLVMAEITSGRSLIDAFGYCYEIAVLGDSGFEYVPSVTYLTWRLRRDGPIRIVSPLVKYQNRGAFSIVQVVDMSRIPVHTHIDAVTPIDDSMPGLTAAEVGEQSMQSEFYSNTLLLEGWARPIVLSLVVHRSDESLMRSYTIGAEVNFEFVVPTLRALIAEATNGI